MTANDSTNNILYSSESSFGQLIIVGKLVYHNYYAQNETDLYSSSDMETKSNDPRPS